jgi:hypothetical protein
MYKRRCRWECRSDKNMVWMSRSDKNLVWMSTIKLMWSMLHASWKVSFIKATRAFFILTTITRAFFGLTTITRASLHFFYIKLHVHVPALYVPHYSTVQARLLPFISFAATCICDILERYYYSSQDMKTEITS